ncbi:MAG: hypothetical protein ACREXX_01470 [Gammaproteobacteria bacterium]
MLKEKVIFARLQEDAVRAIVSIEGRSLGQRGRVHHIGLGVNE